MDRKFVVTLLGIISFVQGFFIAYSHPLDVSNTTFTIYESAIAGVTYIHPVELDRILVMSGGMEPTSITLESYYSLTGVLTRYLSETLQVFNREKPCVMGTFEFQEGLMIDEIYSGGFPISYTFVCSEKVESPIIKITFLNEVPLQTNRLYIYQTLSGVLMRTDYRVLNAKKDSHTLSLVVGEGQKIIDTDGDGLSDEDEILYNTNPNIRDTDGDGYTDMIEIQSSWNPLSVELSPGQRVYSKESDNIETQGSLVMGQGMNLSQDSSVWGGERFTNILRDIRIYADASTQEGHIWLLLLSVGVLGFLHAMGPGHSKGILVSQIIDEGMSYPKSILYCVIFTFIHLLDIIVVVVLTKIFFSILDPSIYLSAIGRVSAVLVVGIGIYIGYYSVRKYRRLQSKDRGLSEEKIERKNYILMAVITGLAPCAFGWSIFLMLMAIGKISLAPPLLLSLGFGIFLCLSLIASITWFTKEKIYSFSPKIAAISPMISSFFIIFIGIGLLIKNF